MCDVFVAGVAVVRECGEGYQQQCSAAVFFVTEGVVVQAFLVQC